MERERVDIHPLSINIYTREGGGLVLAYIELEGPREDGGGGAEESALFNDESE